MPENPKRGHKEVDMTEKWLHSNKLSQVSGATMKLKGTMVTCVLEFVETQIKASSSNAEAPEILR